MSNNRDEFPEKTKKILAERVAWHCSFPNCDAVTVGPSNTDPTNKINNGIAAHITAAAEGGPRYDEKLSSEQRKSLDNGIWMCRQHGNLIDADYGKYTVADLKKWKLEAEKRASQRLEASNSLGGTIGLYTKQDCRVFRAINDILSYDVILKIQDEPFDRFVPDAVIEPFKNILYTENDPLYHFTNRALDELRIKLLKEANDFLCFFSRESAGATKGYHYIDAYRYPDPEYRKRCIQCSENTKSLARLFCATALELREKQKNL
ncbi:TPA: hypothetical protein NJ005_002784 [Vibrio parahaemolyticus]|nr:hypothetical protein [Vibrio parahaemolyticus]